MTGRRDPPREKIAITIRPDLLARIRQRVDQGDEPNVSAFFERAAVSALDAEADLLAWLHEGYEVTGGPPSAQERAWARDLLDGRPPRPWPGR